MTSKGRCSRNRLLLGCLFVVMILLSAPCVQGQGSDQEPNNTCQTATNIGAVTLPSSTFGNLDSTPGSPDIDFYRFTVPPNTPLTIDLEGAFFGGSLPDPFLGLFNSSCVLLATDDDSGEGRNARLEFTVPADGIFIVAVTGCCDPDFQGGSIGSYRLTISDNVAIRSIIGRLVDSVTGNPLTGFSFPFARAELRRCTNGQCLETIAFQSPDLAGQYKFDTDFSDKPLRAGAYKVFFAAQFYQPGETPVFNVAAAQLFDLGPFALTRVPLAGAIRGRVVKAGTGEPLPGTLPPFTRIELRRCSNGQCFEFIGSLSADEQGRFLLDESTLGSPLVTGTYQVIVSASLHNPVQTELFTLGVGESRDFGDLALTPVPLAGSIRGRLIDATTGQGLSGGSPTFAFVRLLRCETFGCFQTVGFQFPDGVGRFTFDRDFSGNPLPAGQFVIQASASFYQEARTESFTVAENEHKDVGNVRVPPLPVRFTNIQPCSNIPATGGTCTYSVIVNNGLPTVLNARAWSLVQSFNTGGFTGSTFFQVSNPPIVSIPAGGTRRVEFQLEVPRSVREGSFICPSVLVGQAASPIAEKDRNLSFFQPLGQTNTLFCIMKQFNQFRILTAEQSRPLLQQLLQRPTTGETDKK